MWRYACFLILSQLAWGQKKPVTIDALMRAPIPQGSTAIWAPDGNRFIQRKGDSLSLYDVATRTERNILPMSALTKSAVAVPPAPAFGWENRRVSEQPFQWTPDGKRLIAITGGDVFLINVEARGYQQLTATPIAERDPKLSPDGRKLAYRHLHDLYVLDLDSRRITRLTHDGTNTLLNGELDWVYPEELDLGTAYWWSPDSQSIAYLQLDISREMVHPHIDMLGLFAKSEPQRYPKAGTPNADVRLGVVAAAGGDTKWMDLGELRDRLLARVHWTPDSAALVAFRLNRIQNELQIVEANPRTAQSKVMLEEKAAAWINIKDDFRWLGKGERFLYGSERDGYRHLYVHERSGKRVAQVTQGEFEVTGIVKVDEAGNRLFFQSTEASPLERHLYRVSLSGGARTKLTKEKGTHTVSMSPSGEYWIDAFSSVLEPPRTTLHNAAGEAIATLRPADNKVEQEYEILPTELLSFKGADGTLFYARLIKPRGFDPAKKYPAVVTIYGGPHAQTVRDSYTGLSFDQVLAHRGFVIWQMDNRGSAGRGHAWEAKVNRKFGKLEVADQVEGVKHLTSLGFVDPARVGITGWSFGGYMTLMAMLHAPTVFKAGISGAPVTDWRHYDTIYTERYMGLPSENAAGYKESSPVHFAKNLTGKLMLIHNFGDDNVLYQNNLQMQVELQKAGKHFDLQVYPQKAHGVTGSLNRHLRETMVEFFERHLTP